MRTEQEVNLLFDQMYGTSLQMERNGESVEEIHAQLAVLLWVQNNEDFIRAMSATPKVHESLERIQTLHETVR